MRHVKVSKELKAAIEIHNTANRIAKVESRKPQRVIRLEARAVRRELMHDATMTKAQRSRAEKVRQARLTVKRGFEKHRKRVVEILSGLPASERKTELGIVLPSGSDIGAVLSRVRDKAV